MINKTIIEEELSNLGINSTVQSISNGPIVSTFELDAKNIRIKDIANRINDLSLAIGGKKIRVLPIRNGKSTIGIEVPNEERKDVYFKNILAELYRTNPSYLDNISIPLFLGKDTEGNDRIYDLAKMPHLLIGGSTGSGKSVCLNSIITGIIATKNPNDIKLILIDPKMIELSIYNTAPHLLFPAVYDGDKIVKTLNMLIKEMEYRYETMLNLNVRNIDDYNNKSDENNKMFKIVLVIDEFADLILKYGKDIEDNMVRLAQLGRACGIHLIIATQRPSVDVITGLIKANFNARIAFKTASYRDSQIILDEMGAEKLLGNGDMLFKNPCNDNMERIHGAYIEIDEIEYIIEKINSTFYLNKIS